jgi:hypothetical protein
LRGKEGSHTVVQNWILLHAARQENALPASAAEYAERANPGELTFADARRVGFFSG